MNERQGPRPPEREPNAEALIPTPEFSVRLLLGANKKDYFKIETPISINTPEELGTIAERNYGIFDRISTTERKAAWQNFTNVPQDKKIDDWAKMMTKSIGDSKDHLKSDPKGKQTATLLSGLGVNIDQPDPDKFKEIYDKYLSKTDGSGIKQFVQDLLENDEYKNVEGKVDIKKIEAALPAVQWVSKVFGQTSSEVITRLVYSEARAKVETEKLLAEATQNSKTLTAIETRILEILSSVSNLTENPNEETERTVEAPPIEETENEKSAEEIFISKLSFDDSERKSKEDLKLEYESVPGNKEMAESLKLAIDEYGEEAIDKLAKEQVDRLDQKLTDIGIEGSRDSKNPSWFLIQASREKHQADNSTDESSNENLNVDPFLVLSDESSAEKKTTAQASIDQILITQLGAEFYFWRLHNRVNPVSILKEDTPQGAKVEFISLITEHPGTGNEYLSREKLNRIGQIINQYHK